MEYSLDFYKNYMDKINQFKEVDWVKNYIELKKKPNFWTILEYGVIASSRQKSSHEIRYSKMLRWLLDANENHNLGNLFAHKLMQEININIDYTYRPDKNKNIKCYTEALEDIDVFYKDRDKNMCIAIELKQFTTEHESTGYDSQLDKYEDVVGRFIETEAPNMQPYYIYLTPTKESPSNDNWYAIGYKEIIDIIDKVNKEYLMNSDEFYKQDIQKIMLDFKDDLQRSVDILEKDIQYIRENFSKVETDFTALLAEEITHEVEASHLDKLIELNNNSNPDLEELIMLINEYNYTQDHTPNDGVRILMRKIYNYIADGPNLDLNLQTKYKAKDRISPIKNDLIEKYDIGFEKIELTRGKGQGLSLYHKNGKVRLYLSGDKDGHVPNDGIQIVTIPDRKVSMKSENIKNRTFEADYDLIMEDKIKFNKNTNDIISIEQLIESYILKEAKVMNDRLN